MPQLLFRRQNVPLFLFFIVGKSLPGAGVGARPSPSSSSTVSPFIVDLPATLALSSPSFPKVIPIELFRFQKLPLLFLFKLGRLRVMLSVPGEDGRKPELSGEVLFDPRLNALKESSFRTLLGRFELL